MAGSAVRKEIEPSAVDTFKAFYSWQRRASREIDISVERAGVPIHGRGPG
jgi:hypothetical protein